MQAERAVTAQEAAQLAPHLHGVADPRSCRVADTGLRHLLIKVRSLPELTSFEPDRATAEAMAAVGGFDTIGYYTRTDQGMIHLRDICAPVGDLEEPASGTTCAAVAAALTPPGESSRQRILQGAAMGSPSLITTSIDATRRALVASSGVITAASPGGAQAW